MKSVVILCDGAFPRKAYPLYLLEHADAVVCCDGAVLKYLRRYGPDRLPDAVVGDMDSLSAAWKERLAPLLVPISEQDDNDMTKAMRFVLEHYPDATEIHLLGATGLREDHTVANLGLLMEYTRLSTSATSGWTWFPTFPRRSPSRTAASCTLAKAAGSPSFPPTTP